MIDRISSMKQIPAFKAEANKLDKRKRPVTGEYMALLNLRKLETDCFCGNGVDLLTKISQKSKEIYFWRCITLENQ